MSLTGDILLSYRQPRRVIRRRLDAGPREDRALALLIGACLLMFAAQWPRLARAAHLHGEIPLEVAIGGALFGWLFVAPLGLYLLAWLSHLVARLLGGRGSAFGARMALFWALLAAAPLFLLQGLVAGLIGPGPELAATGLVALGAFLLIWGICLVEAETRAGAAA